METFFLDKIAKKKTKVLYARKCRLCVLHCFIPSNKFIHP